MSPRMNVTEEYGSNTIFRKQVKAFLDLLILALLEEETRCGYGILAKIHRRFKILLSPGTLYPLLHSLEKEGFIEGHSNSGKKNYRIKNKGSNVLKRFSKDFKNSSYRLISFMEQSFGDTQSKQIGEEKDIDLEIAVQ